MVHFRLVLVGALAAALALAGAAPASGGPSDYVRIKGAKQETGPFKSQLKFNLETGQAKNVYLKVKSLTGFDEGAFLIQDYFPSDSKLKYFTKNGTDITMEVQDVGGYLHSVRGDKVKRFRVKVKQTGSTLEDCIPVKEMDDASGGLSTVVLALNIAPAAC